MSNVRKYLRTKESREKKRPDIDYREKIRSHKLVIFYRTALALALTAAVAAVIVIQWKNKVYTQSMVTSSMSVQTVRDTTSLDLGGMILTYSKDGANLMDSKGTVIWNETFEMQAPMVEICENVAAIGDYNGHTIYLMSTSGRLGTIDTNMPIRSFCVSAEGVVAAVLDDSDITWIYLFDKEGNTLVHFKTTMKKSGYPMGVSISPNGKLVGVSYLYVDSGKMTSTVGFYNFGSVGQNELDNFVGGYDYSDTVVPLIQFMDSQNAFAVADSRLMFYQGGEVPLSAGENLLEGEIRGVYYNKEFVGLVFDDTSGEAGYRLDVYGGNGEKILSCKFDMEYKEILFHKDLIIIYNGAQCKILNMKGAEKFEGTFDKTVQLLLPTSTVNKYILLTEDSVDTIELK